MTHSSRRFLHVANGTATTGLIDAAGIPGLRSIWADVLYEGPVPAGLSDGELLEVRDTFLRDDARDVDPVNDLRQWRAAIDERRDTYDELILWYEHDLFDQLNLIQLLSWIRERVSDEKTVSLVMIGSFPGRTDFKGLGELTPGELASLLDQRKRVSERQYEIAAEAWNAFRSATPEALDAIRQRDTSALPFLAPAIARFLQEYPWTRDGLSRTERRLLSLARDGGIDLRSAFPRMHDGEDAYYMTGGSLASTASELAQTSPPLAILDEPAASNRQLLAGSVALTDAGRAVLAGDRDRIALCGIDRWLGGVHLQSGDSMWRWDERRQGIVAS